MKGETMVFNNENVLATISSLGAILLVLYVIGNFLFHITINDKIVRVTGYELKSVNIILVILIMMFIIGLGIGYIFEFVGIYVTLFTPIILAVLYLVIEKCNLLKFINATGSTQIIVYLFFPFIVGGVWGGSLKEVFKFNMNNNVRALADVSCIMLLSLVLTILLVGKYWSEKFQSNKCVKVKGADFEKNGILLAEKDGYIFLEIDKKIIRIKKDQIVSIEELESD